MIFISILFTNSAIYSSQFDSTDNDITIMSSGSARFNKFDNTYGGYSPFNKRMRNNDEMDLSASSENQKFGQDNIAKLDNSNTIENILKYHVVNINNKDYEIFMSNSFKKKIHDERFINEIQLLIPDLLEGKYSEDTVGFEFGFCGGRININPFLGDYAL